MALKIKSSTLTKGLLVFVLLSVGIMVGILIWTTEAGTWQQFIQFDWRFIPLIIFLGVIRWFVDGMAFVTMAKHGSKSSISLCRAALIRLEGSLVSNIVPVLVGNFGMHTYLLHKEKLKLHESIAITVLRAILPVFLFLLNIPILIIFRDALSGDKLFGILLKAISLPIAGMIIAMVITLFYPDRIKQVANAIVKLLRRNKRISKERIQETEQKLFHEIDQFSGIFWSYLKSRKWMMIKATVWLALAFIIDYFIAMAILWGFGYFPPLIRALAMQNLMRPIIFFALTPGGAGVWEFTYLGFFSLYMPQHLIGISVLIWRSVITHLPSIVAAFFLYFELKTDKHLKKMLTEQGKITEEELEKETDLEKDNGWESP